MSRQHDAHVRCRAKLIRRIVRRYQDSVAARRLPIPATTAGAVAAIVAALAAYDWPAGWDLKWVGRYEPYPTDDHYRPGPHKVKAKTIPVATIDNIVLGAWRRMRVQS